MGNWPFTWALIAIAVLCSIVPYALDRRHGDAPAAFGLPAVLPAGAVGRAPTGTPLELQDLAPMPGQASTTAGMGSHGA
jgi:hypothetical protein